MTPKDFMCAVRVAMVVEDPDGSLQDGVRLRTVGMHKFNRAELELRRVPPLFAIEGTAILNTVGAACVDKQPQDGSTIQLRITNSDLDGLTHMTFVATGDPNVLELRSNPKPPRCACCDQPIGAEHANDPLLN